MSMQSPAGTPPQVSQRAAVRVAADRSWAHATCGRCACTACTDSGSLTAPTTLRGGVHAGAGRTMTPLAGPGGAASPPAAPSAWLLNMMCPAAPSAPELPAGSCASVRASDVLPPPSPEKYLARHAAQFVLCVLHYCHGMMNVGSSAWHPGQQGARQHGSPARAVLAVSLAVDPASASVNAQLGAASSTFVWLCGDLGLDRRGVRSPTLAQAWSRPHLKRPSNVWSWPRASSNA